MLRVFLCSRTSVVESRIFEKILARTIFSNQRKKKKKRHTPLPIFYFEQDDNKIKHTRRNITLDRKTSSQESVRSCGTRTNHIHQYVLTRRRENVVVDLSLSLSLSLYTPKKSGQITIYHHHQQQQQLNDSFNLENFRIFCSTDLPVQVRPRRFSLAPENCTERISKPWYWN